MTKSLTAKFGKESEKMKKNDIVKVEIVDISHDGQGIGKAEDGFVVFVRTALLGEILNVHILKVLKNKAFGKIKDIIKASDMRTEPSCDAFYKCGGCTFWHTAYENELLIKQSLVKSALKSVSNIDFDVSDIIPSENELKYRNKMLIPIGYDEKGDISFGFYRMRSHTIIKNDECSILDDVFYVIAKCVVDFMVEFSVEPYSEEYHKGVIRHLFVRKAEYTGEIMVGIITSTKRLKNSHFLVEKLTSLNKNIVSVVHNVNPEKTNVILGKKTNLLYGKPYITDMMNGIKFNVSMLSFYQINTKQAEKLYNIAISLMDEGNDIVFDLYSGIGTIALNIAKNVKDAKCEKKVYGIESVAEAVSDANTNKELNNIENAEFICDLVENAVPRLISEGITPNVIVLDPPRSGCEKTLIDTIIASKADKIIYISCNPATLARDIKIFTENDYNIKLIQPVDMFPKTYHVETIVLLERIGKL